METQKKTKSQIEKDSRQKHNMKSFSVYINGDKLTKLTQKLKERRNK